LQLARSGLGDTGSFDRKRFEVPQARQLLQAEVGDRGLVETEPTKPAQPAQMDQACVDYFVTPEIQRVQSPELFQLRHADVANPGAGKRQGIKLAAGLKRHKRWPGFPKGSAGQARGR
jgi:hypothetical protein